MFITLSEIAELLGMLRKNGTKLNIVINLNVQNVASVVCTCKHGKSITYFIYLLLWCFLLH